MTKWLLAIQDFRQPGLLAVRGRQVGMRMVPPCINEMLCLPWISSIAVLLGFSCGFPDFLDFP